MDIYYKLGQINSDNDNEFIYNISVSYKKKNKNYKLESYVNIDLINDYPNYKFIKNSNYLYYRVTTKNNMGLNIGDIQQIPHKDKINYKLAKQYEYDKYNYLCNRDTCNARLYRYIYNYVINYFKIRYHSNKKIKETEV